VAKVNEEKNAARERAIQIKTRRAENAYIIARTKERRLFRKKTRQLDEEAKYMIVARNARKICDVRQSVAIGDKHFEVVKEFVYQGSLMTPTNDVSLEIQRRIQTAHMCSTSAVETPFTPDKIQQSPFKRP
jgi:hypothetical protein